MIQQLVERVVDVCIELVEGALAVERKECVVSEGLEEGRAEWGVDAVEQLEDEDAERRPSRAALTSSGRCCASSPRKPAGKVGGVIRWRGAVE